jgi:excisionase family DNA binding protein
MITQHVSIDGSGSRLLGLQEAATYLGITPRSVYRLVEQGFLIPVRLPGLRRTLFDRRNLEDFVELARTANPWNRDAVVGGDGVEAWAGEVQG